MLRRREVRWESGEEIGGRGALGTRRGVGTEVMFEAVE